MRRNTKDMKLICPSVEVAKFMLQNVWHDQWICSNVALPEITVRDQKRGEVMLFSKYVTQYVLKTQGKYTKEKQGYNQV